MNTFGSSPFANIPPVVKNLLIINVIFFLATVLFQQGDNSPLIHWLAIYYPGSPDFRIWQVITYMFMHGSFEHIFFNMFALFTFGVSLEYVLGAKRFLNFYLITGLGALVLQFLVQSIEVYQITGSMNIDPNTYQSSNPEAIRTLSGIYYGPMLGASGAIFGLLIAFGMLFPNIELCLFFIPRPIKSKY